MTNNVTLPRKIKHFYNFVDAKAKNAHASALLKCTDGKLEMAFTNSYVLLLLSSTGNQHPDFECLVPPEAWENVKMAKSAPRTVSIVPACFSDDNMLRLKQGNLTTECESPDKEFVDYRRIFDDADDDEKQFTIGDKTFLTCDVMANVFSTLKSAGVEAVEMSHVKAGDVMTLTFTFSSMSGKMAVMTRSAI